MTKLNKALIAVLVVQFALAVLVYTRDDGASIGKAEPLFPGVETSSVVRVQIYDDRGESPDAVGGGEVNTADVLAVDLVKSGESWTLTSHFDYPAKADAVTELLDKLTPLTSRGPIATSTKRFVQLGVADDNYRRKIALWTDTSGDKPAFEFYLGENTGARKVALRLAGKDAVHAVTGITPFNARPAASAWVDTTYFELPKEQIAWFQVQNAAGVFTFGRALGADGTDTWEHLVDGAPAAAPAGQEFQLAKVTGLLSGITKVTLAEPADPAREVSSPLATVTVRLKPEPAAGGASSPDGASGEPGDDPANPAGADPGADAADGDPANPGAASAAPVDAIAGEEMVFQIGPERDGEEQYLFRHVGNPRAVWVAAYSVRPIVELTADQLYAEPAAEPAPAPSPAMPPGLPPGFPPMAPPGGP